MNEELGQLITELDTASGMLLVAAIKDPTIKKAMEMISKVSFDLGNIISDFEGGE